MDLKIQDQTEIVTGGGNGIGEAIALRLASEGAKVVVADMDLFAAQKAAGRIQGTDGNATALADKSLLEIFEAHVRSVTPLRRPQPTDEIAGLVAYLASYEARSITGQAISIDGGIATG